MVFNFNLVFRPILNFVAGFGRNSFIFMVIFSLTAKTDETLTSSPRSPSKHGIEGPDYVKTVTPHQLSSMIEQKNIEVIDLRSTEEYTKGYIPTAVSVPFSILSEHIFSADTVVVYSTFAPAGEYACKLILNKYPNKKVFNLESGIFSWNDARLPLKVFKKSNSIIDETFVFIGLFTAIGGALSIVNKWFLIIPIFIGIVSYIFKTKTLCVFWQICYQKLTKFKRKLFSKYI